jgi:predicted nucleic acid-binding protein
MNAAVFDTNVLVSGLLSPHGAPGRLVDALQQGICQAVVDDSIWDEYVEVLGRPGFGFPPADTAVMLARIRKNAIHAPSTFESIRQVALPDPDDVPFIACAAALSVPLVTGNLKHFPRRVVGKVEVQTPAVYVRQLSTVR